MLVSAGQDVIDQSLQKRHVGTDKRAGAGGNRNWPFRVAAQREARNLEHGRFLLQSARVGHDQSGLRRKPEKLQIAQRRREPNARRSFQCLPQAGRFEPRFACAGGRGTRSATPLRFVSLTSQAMLIAPDHRRSRAGAWSTRHIARPPAPSLPVAATPCGRKLRHKHVDHHIADKPDCRFRPPFLQQILHAIGFTHEQQPGHGIGQHAIDLFGHGAVELRKPAST